jgi:hypothetical protein
MNQIGGIMIVTGCWAAIAIPTHVIEQKRRLMTYLVVMLLKTTRILLWIANHLYASPKKDPHKELECGLCPDGYHKIHAFVDPGKDFHFYRQDRDGNWSHKRRMGKVTNRDASGNKIADPSKANRNYSGDNN